jgi:hypothetical protein
MSARMITAPLRGSRASETRDRRRPW